MKTTPARIRALALMMSTDIRSIDEEQRPELFQEVANLLTNVGDVFLARQFEQVAHLMVKERNNA